MQRLAGYTEDILTDSRVNMLAISEIWVDAAARVNKQFSNDLSFLCERCAGGVAVYKRNDFRFNRYLSNVRDVIVS